jgi:ribosome-associated protein
MIENDTNQKAEPSKSELKRTAHAQQALGERLTRLAIRQLKTLELPEALFEAIDEFHRLPKSHLARRRQLQFIGKLMRDINQPAIERQLQALETPAPSQSELTPAEIWTEYVLGADASVIESLLHLAPTLDRQKLRQLQRKASKVKENTEQDKIRRQLHTYISEYL